MKKVFTLIALGTMMIVPQTVKAQWTKYVTNKSEFLSALGSFEGQNGVVDSIVIVGPKDADGNYTIADNQLIINTGDIKTSGEMANVKDGTLVITSNQTDIDNLPRLQTGMNFVANDASSHLSIVFENVSVEYRAQNSASSGQVLYWNKVDAIHVDSIVFNKCHIANIPRSLIRTVPNANADSQYESTLNKFVMTNCKVHDNNTLKGNSWAIIYLGCVTNEITVRNNMFYNMPFSKNIITYNYIDPTGTDTELNFENNLVVIACGTGTDANGEEGTTAFDVINVGKYLGVMSTYNINNNIMLTPQLGEYPVWQNLTEKKMVNFSEYGETRPLVCTGGMVFAANNVMEGYNTWNSGNNKDEETKEYTWILGPEDNEGRQTMEEAGLSWSDFYDAATSDFRLEKSHALYAQNIGPAMMYVDKFPVRATVKVNIEGSNTVEYEISPVKENYNVGDEVTITLKDHNSYYRTLNEFLGWSDGNTENPRTITLDGPVELTAVYESEPVFNYIDFSRLTKNDNNMVSYEADIFADEANKAVVTVMFADSIEGNPYVAASADGYKFQGRPAKFGEDPEEMRIPCITRRTTAQRRGYGKMDYVCISFSTKDLTGIKVSGLVGTDNFCYKTQKLDFSLDGENWTTIGSLELETRDADFSGTTGILAGWADLNGELPIEAENQEKVYVRVISDPASDAITNPAAGELDLETVDAFEYVGSILITADSNSQGINEVNRSSQTASPVYNLMGMKVAGQSKGLLIQNGRKFIVK